MRRLLLLTALLAAGCEVPIEQAKTGDRVSQIHVRDLRTQKCIKISDNGKYTDFRVVPPHAL